MATRKCSHPRHFSDPILLLLTFALSTSQSPHVPLHTFQIEWSIRLGSGCWSRVIRQAGEDSRSWARQLRHSRGSARDRKFGKWRILGVYEDHIIIVIV